MIVHFMISECVTGHLITSMFYSGSVLQAWSLNCNGEIIEHSSFTTYKGRSKNKNNFTEGDKIGIIFPNTNKVMLGRISRLPASKREVLDYREEYRELCRGAGIPFKESELIHSDEYPKETYMVALNNQLYDVPPFQIVPLPNNQSNETH